MSELKTSAQLCQMDLVSAIFREIARQEKDMGMLSRQMNVVCQAATLIVEAFKKGYTPAEPGCGFDAWLASDDVGLSSQYMAHVAGLIRTAQLNWPHDADDFSRCYKFLRAVIKSDYPWGKLRDSCPQWRALVEAWSSLESLYAHGKHQQLTDTIQQLTK